MTDKLLTSTLATLAFYAHYHGWHSFSATCFDTVAAIVELESKGFVEINAFGQARFTGKTSE